MLHITGNDSIPVKLALNASRSSWKNRCRSQMLPRSHHAIYCRNRCKRVLSWRCGRFGWRYGLRTLIIQTQRCVTATFKSIDQNPFFSTHRFCLVVELYKQKGPAYYDVLSGADTPEWHWTVQLRSFLIWHCVWHPSKLTAGMTINVCFPRVSW